MQWHTKRSEVNNTLDTRQNAGDVTSCIKSCVNAMPTFWNGSTYHIVSCYVALSTRFPVTFQAETRSTMTYIVSTSHCRLSSLEFRCIYKWLFRLWGTVESVVLCWKSIKKKRHSISWRYKEDLWSSKSGTTRWAGYGTWPSCDRW